ncbi:MAG: DegT/DnrJ/EryC1/StrS family aminotransferase, partial [Candidatus Omnitrophica bacterium]|nr:DegT/DnrJ/EryC1/StrS family aminotransferase [Candidatus Omnitrophota bacterium]
TDIQAAFGRVQLKKLGAMIAARQKVAAGYSKAFQKLNVILPQADKGAAPVFYRYVVRVPDAAAGIITMKKNGINAERPLFRPLHYYLGMTGYPNADRLFKEALSLPIYPSLSPSEQKKIIQTVRNIFDRD